MYYLHLTLLGNAAVPLLAVLLAVLGVAECSRTAARCAAFFRAPVSVPRAGKGLHAAENVSALAVHSL